VQALDPQMPLTNVLSTRELFDQALWAPRMGASLLGMFGLLALALAAVGVHGVMSYSVTQRTQEIGIRMALGARPGDVIRLVLRQAMFIVGIGAAVGLGGTFVATFLAERFLTEVLFVKAGDPLAFLGTASLLAGVALFACYLPARRASRIDPLIALRYE
jgi:putative ABC transport system permease protein